MHRAFVTAPFPGVLRAGQEGQKLGLWDLVVLGEHMGRIPTADTYILGAWHPEYERLLTAFGDSKVGVCWTSSGGELDLEPIERQYLQAIMLNPAIDFVWFGDQCLAEAFKDKGFYAPYPLFVPTDRGDFQPQPKDKDKSVLFFSPGGPKKNVYNQLLGVAIVQRRKDCHFTLETNLQHYKQDMDELGIHYRMHDWLAPEDLKQLQLKAKVNMCVSWAETFSYSVADCAILGTPSLISLTVPLPGVICAFPNYPLSIANPLEFLLFDEGQARYVWEEIAARAKKFNEDLSHALTKRSL